MSKVPVKATARKAELRKRDAGAVEIAAPPQVHGGFFSFRYSSTEVWSQGGRTHVKARQTQLVDGKLRTESFEGETAAGAYDGLVRQAQQQVLDQAAWLMRSMAWLLPPPLRRQRDEE